MWVRVLFFFSDIFFLKRIFVFLVKFISQNKILILLNNIFWREKKERSDYDFNYVNYYHNIFI